MRKGTSSISAGCLIFVFAIFFSGTDHESSVPPSKGKANSVMTENPGEINRSIDASKQVRSFPDLTGYRNTSLQKVPAPVLAEIAEKTLGKPEITRCWLNLDEMWDYRTRQFNFDFQIGVDKYRDIPDKFRESWNWEIESSVSFYQYIKAFSEHSHLVMLTIRRYERDILDKKLPVSMEDWKMLFREGLKHYKKLFPNIRYVEVCNEYELKGFMGATDEEYYRFYRLAYEAVNEANKELGLKADNCILVGGPVVTGSFDRLEHFIEFYSQDKNQGKKLDFISWHEYHQDVSQTANREKEIKVMLTKYNLSLNIPMFISEHDPFHFSDDKREYHFANAAWLHKTLYFTSLYSPQIKIFPWVLYHNPKIQTKFMWFDGPDKPDTKASEIHTLPLGASMKFLSMLKGKEVQVENTITGKDLVLATVQKDRFIIEAINYEEIRNVKLTVRNLNKAFPGSKKLRVIKYLIDSKHSNWLDNPEYQGDIEKVEDNEIALTNSRVTLKQDNLEKNGLVLWELIQMK
jgi:hypothetical protein